MKKELFFKKNKIRRISLNFFILIFSQLNSTSYLLAGEGKTAANFLLENLDAKEVARGGVGAVKVLKLDALSSNPASLAQILQPDINFSNGTTQSFSAEKSFAAGITVSGMFSNWFNIGVSPKMINSTLVDQYTGRSYALDAGILFFPFPKRVNLGATIKNLGSKLSYKSKEHDLPLFESVGLGLDLWDNENYGALSMGTQGERVLGEKIKVRVGGDYGLGGEKVKMKSILPALTMNFWIKQ